ncbi:MAG TPA: serine/threonine-protein kinase [Solirubrobacterales bacterium]|nr:serine/threonine-protein kinase [Solirubrobacterales bacterium]
MATIGAGELLKDRYRIERTLGHGGMAAVWLGHDEVLDRPVAVKVLADTIASDPGFVTRFRREATTAAGLTHPNLVGVYDFSEEGERPYLVMQFVPGESLAARLERGEEVDRGKLARELLQALDHIHRAGILHRDVKPGNVILEPDGTAKLIDFGIALARDATSLTSTGLVLGTERYAAPEVMEGHAASERSDLYSLGVVLRACPGTAPAGFDGLVEWLADPDPRNRPASARQALARLEQADRVSEEPTRAYTPTSERERTPTPPPVPPLRPDHSRGARRGALVALLAFVAAVIAIAVVVLGGGDGGNGDANGLQASKPNQAKKSDNSGSAGKAENASTPASAQEPEEAEPEAEPEDASSGGVEPEATGGTDPEGGAALNQQGYELIQAGEYEAAVPVLEEAVASFPAGSEDLDYAYALFNLGSALRQSGRPEEAIPVLEERLQIPNQTATVEEELAAARAEAG